MESSRTPTRPRSDKRSYHHGALKEALITATEQLLAESGVEGFSLREAARRAGVSPAAPVHHFGDARGLLTAVAARAFEGLRARLAAAEEQAPEGRRARLRAQGWAYVQFAIERPGGFDLMFRATRLDFEDPALAVASKAAFAVLARVFEPEASPEDALASPPPVALGAWSIVHGFARLHLDGQFPQVGPEALEALFEAAVGKALDAFAEA